MIILARVPALTLWMVQLLISCRPLNLVQVPGPGAYDLPNLDKNVSGGAFSLVSSHARGSFGE